MTPEQWREVQRICEGALACAPSERSEYVAAACAGDDALRREVESLLANADSADHFIEEPAFAAAGALGSLSGLRAGQRLGPYHIVSKIGAGGMGEVYRARDTQLGREVAVKIVPPVFAADPERLARFEREARVLASLNHPHIAGIYGVHADVSDNGRPVRALVMELVEGPTLAERIAQGPVPMAEALPIARQIADALAAAHEKGIVHRDLKPANIKLTPDGVVKVLDFGLAKAADQVTGQRDMTNSPTVTTGGTQGGVLLGTAAYMSPEQARGQEVDRRTDIWAFGCVLYELVTGRAVFSGATVTDVLAHVIERDPDLTLLPTNTPRPVRYLLSQCLDKNPKQRLRDIDAARFAFDLTQSERTDAGLQGAHRKQGFALGRLVATGALIAIVGVSAVLYLYLSAPPLIAEIEITPPPGSLPFEFALAPNSSHIVFVATPESGPRRLWLRSLERPDVRPLDGTDGANYPFWSADSRYIGFFASGKLYRIDINGGPPQQLAESLVGGGAWSADNVILFSAIGGRLARIPASGGEPVEVTHVDSSAPTVHISPEFLPDGRHFLFYAVGTAQQSGVYLASLDGGTAHRLTPADSAAAYVAPDWLLFVRLGKLMARRFDLSREQFTSEEVVVADSVGTDFGGHGGFSASADGRIAYQGDLVELWSFDRFGRSQVVIGGADARDRLANPELSPDGKRVAVTRSVQNNVDVWIKDLVSGVLTRFTTDASFDAFPLWSRDGTIEFSSNRTGVPRLYSKSSSSTGAGRELVLLDEPVGAQDRSRDGRFILYSPVNVYSNANPTRRDIWVFDVMGKKSRAIVDSQAEERNGQFSPDMRWITYETDESNRFEVVVQAFPDGGQVWHVSHDGGTQPRWSPDGREIYFLAPGGKMMAARVTATNGKTQAIVIEKPVDLFPTRIREGGVAVARPQYDVTSEDNFLVMQSVETSRLPLTVILNWKPSASK